MWSVLLVGIVLLVNLGCSDPTLAGDDYREEFYSYVIFPCYTELLQQKGLAEHMTVDEFITFSKGMGVYATMQEAENRVVNLVQGMSLAQRETVYSASLSSCLSSIDQK